MNTIVANILAYPLSYRNLRRADLRHAELEGVLTVTDFVKNSIYF